MPHNDKAKQSAASKSHYERNKGVYKRRAKEFTQVARKRNREWAIDYLKNHPCVDCGETDPLVLEFDHRESETKTGTVCKMINRPCSLRSIEAEVDKCDVRCANCHRRRTHQQLGWWGEEK